MKADVHLPLRIVEFLWIKICIFYHFMKRNKKPACEYIWLYVCVCV